MSSGLSPAQLTTFGEDNVNIGFSTANNSSANGTPTYTACTSFDEPHEFQAVEKRRNAEFINGLLTMERLNAIGKRSPPVPDVDDVQQLFWRPQHPFFWTE
uniref:Uncharacterized protein n=1 Tax=Globodera pallida TaxID=36090 RepID=A0A183C004_GLOPA